MKRLLPLRPAVVPTDRASTSGTDPDGRVLAERLGMVLRHGTAGVLAAMVVGAIYSAAIWDVSAPDTVLAWLGVMAVSGVFRIILHRTWARRRRRNGSGRYWPALVLTGSTFAGACWGYAATALFPIAHSDRILAVGFLLIGMPAGALSSFAAWFPAYAGYVLASVGPFALSLFLAGEMHMTLAGLAATTFAVFILREGWVTSATIQRNIAQRVEVERLSQSLAEARDAAETASRAKSVFLANMSHELRTPLTAVIGMSDLLAHDAKDPEIAARAATIQRSGQNLLEIINDVLDLSQIEAGRLELRHEAFDLTEMTAGIDELFRPVARAKGLAFTTSVGSDAPRRLETDPGRLRQIIVNLVGNAIKFTASGEVCLSASVVRVSGDDVVLRFEVRDTGIGIADAVRDRLFQPFSQVHDDAARQYGGTGLGLNISRQLVHLLGGEIGVTSTPGAGSVFWFTIRARAVPLARVRQGEAGPAMTDCGEPERADTPGVRALVVDDNPVNLMLASRMLASLGCTVETASSGQDALEVLSTRRFDIVFMDGQMPGMDGIEATRRWRAAEQPGSPRLPIVALTASAMEGDREKFLAGGMDDYVSKPFRADDLRKMLERHVGRACVLVAPAGERRSA
ncbi:MAG: response regulator [Betaproteobacteria bacterium]|nr:response regulator [Betaproteobacteria bacterium]